METQTQWADPGTPDKKGGNRQTGAEGWQRRSDPLTSRYTVDPSSRLASEGSGRLLRQASSGRSLTHPRLLYFLLHTMTGTTRPHQRPESIGPREPADESEGAGAFATLRHANGLAAAVRPWDAEDFQRTVQAIRTAFDAPGAQAPAGQGSEVIFLVGLPRSATTLTEQILASHSQVEGASELPYLGRVIEQESRRRGRSFPDWVPTATADDWARVGQAYLQMSARWRASKRVATDKLPGNWCCVGAALRMLPAARVIDCRRDPVETCWSCYKQLFGPGMVHFSYSFEGLAGYWHAYDALCRFWAQCQPGRVRMQRYDAPVEAPQEQIRQLLTFCGLASEPACLNFHTARRAIRTPSALQVRQPLGQVSAPAARYGQLVDGRRQLLVP